MGKYSIAVSLVISSLGALLFCFKSPYLMAFGAVMVGIGLSVSGYLIKSEVSQCPSGAAHNKIALNVGSLLSGIIILVFLGTKNLFFSLAALLLLICAVISFLNSHKQKDITLPIPRSFCKRKFIGWLLVGISVGIKFFGVFSVLPQYLISELHQLPNWYGIMIFVNSIVIIVFQLPIIHLIEKFKINNLSFKITLSIMLFGMLIIAFPKVFYAQTFIGALIWTILLSIIECCASYLDVQGARAGYLLIKETAVGLGAGLTVLICRYVDPSIASITTGALGVLVIFSVYFLLYDDLKATS